MGVEESQMTAGMYVAIPSSNSGIIGLVVNAGMRLIAARGKPCISSLHFRMPDYM